MECSHRLDVWNFHTVYVFLDNNFVVKESNKGNHLNLQAQHSIRVGIPFKRTRCLMMRIIIMDSMKIAIR
jgi:hypothetical protein